MNCLLCQSEDLVSYGQLSTREMARRQYFKCGRCDLIFASPSSHLAINEQKPRYDRHQNDAGENGYRDFLSRLTKPLIKRLAKESLGLDFGCGPNPAIDRLMAAKGHRVRNFDPLYFPRKECLSQKYDFIILSEVAEHFTHPRREFLLLKRLLKEKSFLAIMTGMHDKVKDLNGWWYVRDVTHHCFYSKKTFGWIAEWLKMDVDFPAKNVVILANEI